MTHPGLRSRWLAAAALAALAALLLAPLGAAAQAVKGKVTDGAELPLAGVTVYLVPGARRQAPTSRR